MIESNTDLLKQPLLALESVKTLSLNNIVKNISLTGVIKVVSEIIKSNRFVLVCIGSLLGFVCVMSYCTNKIKQMRLELEDTVQIQTNKVALKKHQAINSLLSQRRHINIAEQPEYIKSSIAFSQQIKKLQIINKDVKVLMDIGLISQIDKDNTTPQEIKKLRLEQMDTLNKLICKQQNNVSGAKSTLLDFLNSSDVAAIVKAGDLSTVTPKSSKDYSLELNQCCGLEKDALPLTWKQRALEIEKLQGTNRITMSADEIEKNTGHK